MRIRLLVGMALAAMSLVAAGEDGMRYRDGLDLYERGQYAAALDILTRSAEDGDVRAQEMVALMQLAGPSLYGASVPGDLDAAHAWLVRAARSGSEPARAMLCARRHTRSAACAELRRIASDGRVQ